MKKTDAAWLAGYIDGDGCITMWRANKKSHRSPVIIVASTDYELLERCQEIANGWIVRKNKETRGIREQWNWVVRGAQKVLNVLREVEPFMACADKKARANLLLAEWNKCTPKNGWYTEKTLEAKISFEEKFLLIGQGRKGSKHYPSSTMERPRIRAQHSITLARM